MTNTEIMTRIFDVLKSNISEIEINYPDSINWDFETLVDFGDIINILNQDYILENLMHFVFVKVKNLVILFYGSSNGNSFDEFYFLPNRFYCHIPKGYNDPFIFTELGVTNCNVIEVEHKDIEDAVAFTITSERERLFRNVYLNELIIESFGMTGIHNLFYGDKGNQPSSFHDTVGTITCNLSEPKLRDECIYESDIDKSKTMNIPKSMFMF